MNVAELIEKILNDTEGETAPPEIGIYDEAGNLYEIVEIDAQGGGGTPLAIRIRRV